MRLVQLNDKLLDDIEDRIKRGLPEYSVCKMFHIAQSTWQLWKKGAKDLRDVINSELESLVENGTITEEDHACASFDGKRFVIGSGVEKKFIPASTTLTTSQQKMMRLLEICEEGKERVLLEHIDNIKKHSLGDWKASAWFIERRARREFGRQETVVNKNLNVDVTDTLSDEEAQQFKNNLATVFPNLGEKE